MKKRKRAQRRKSTGTRMQAMSKPIKRLRRVRTLSAGSSKLSGITKMTLHAILGGVIGGKVISMLPDGNSRTTGLLIKAVGAIGGAYVINNSLKLPFLAAGFAAGAGRSIVQELNIPLLSDFMPAEYVSPGQLNDTILLDENGDIIEMSDMPNLLAELDDDFLQDPFADEPLQDELMYIYPDATN
jgi:hypothetical protein